MPKIVDSGVKKVMKTWKSKEQAYAIITSTLKKAKILDKNWNLTALWKKRNAMTSKQREKIPLAKMRTKNKSKSSSNKTSKWKK